MYVHIPYKTNDICLFNKKVDIIFTLYTIFME